MPVIASHASHASHASNRANAAFCIVAVAALAARHWKLLGRTQVIIKLKWPSC
jgi:hypothetical protein